MSVRKFLPGVQPRPMLLIELDGTKESLEPESLLIEKWLQEEAIEFRKANSEDEAEKLWEVRRQGSSSMKKLATEVK